MCAVLYWIDDLQVENASICNCLPKANSSNYLYYLYFFYYVRFFYSEHNLNSTFDFANWQYFLVYFIGLTLTLFDVYFLLVYVHFPSWIYHIPDNAFQYFLYKILLFTAFEFSFCFLQGCYFLLPDPTGV